MSKIFKLFFDKRYGDDLSMGQYATHAEAEAAIPAAKAKLLEMVAADGFDDFDKEDVECGEFIIKQTVFGLYWNREDGEGGCFMGQYETRAEAESAIPAAKAELLENCCGSELSDKREIEAGSFSVVEGFEEDFKSER